MTPSAPTARGRVDGKIVIVSGGARGMGAAHAKMLVAEGARVVLMDVREDQGASLASELGAAASFVHADVTSPSDWGRTVQLARETFGEPTGLINNAGILDTGTLEEMTLEQFRRSIDVLQVSVFLGMKAVIPSMKAVGGGSIVNISSTGGMVGFRDIIGYVAAKWAVRGMTRQRRSSSLLIGFGSTRFTPAKLTRR